MAFLSNPKMSNVFVFTSLGSVLIKCEPNADVKWLLETCTSRMAGRGLSGEFVEARQEDGIVVDSTELISTISDAHPV